MARQFLALKNICYLLNSINMFLSKAAFLFIIYNCFLHQLLTHPLPCFSFSCGFLSRLLCWYHLHDFPSPGAVLTEDRAVAHPLHSTHGSWQRGRYSWASNGRGFWGQRRNNEHDTVALFTWLNFAWGHRLAYELEVDLCLTHKDVQLSIFCTWQSSSPHCTFPAPVI